MYSFKITVEPFLLLLLRSSNFGFKFDRFGLQLMGKSAKFGLNLRNCFGGSWR